MGLEPDTRLVINRAVDVRKLPLTPTEFFLFSRVESLGDETAVGDAVAASGQPEASALKALERLVELRALTVTGARAARVSAAVKPDASSSNVMRDRARSRRRELLEAQLRSARGSSATAAGSSAKVSATREPPARAAAPEESPLPTPRREQSASFEQGPRSILDEVEPVAASDPRLEPSAAVDLDRQRRLLALRDRLRHVGHFALLGLDPVDDAKAIRRAYHVVSREFHPDSFYGKNLGSFRVILDDLFRRARASYEFLLDPQRRRPLVDAHQAQLEAERARVAQEQARIEAAVERTRTDAEREAQEQRRRLAEQREERDSERAKRIQERALEQRKKQARKHAEQARRERDGGRYGTAATLFRLAFEHDPSSSEYEQQWRDSLAQARRQRAESNFAEGKSALDRGRVQEAARHLTTAAEADPTLRNLGAAAAAVAAVDPAKARQLAMSALEVLQQAQARGLPLDPQIVAQVHQACAKAFLAVGQAASAKEQAERAHALAPSDETLTLLNSIKLT